MAYLTPPQTFDESADQPNQPELHEQSEDVSMEESLEEPAIS